MQQSLRTIFIFIFMNEHCMQQQSLDIGTRWHENTFSTSEHTVPSLRWGETSRFIYCLMRLVNFTAP